jgi:hypothetical protein
MSNIEISPEELSYIQRVADFLLQQTKGMYINIKAISADPVKFIAAAKMASVSYCFSITFTPDYNKIKCDLI